MGDLDSSILDIEITLDPEIIANIKRVVHRCKEYLRHPRIHAADTPSVIWRVGQEYERNRKKISRNETVYMNRSSMHPNA